MKNLRVGILFGGRSGEHDVSLLSAASVPNAIDKDKGRAHCRQDFEVAPGTSRAEHASTDCSLVSAVSRRSRCLRCPYDRSSVPFPS
jgi:D-alanine-D-alanine ligase-like ATP-grasp enzyme